jgi:hypothetical protein
MLMVLSAGCASKSQPETQPPPVATAPQAGKPAEAAPKKPPATAVKDAAPSPVKAAAPSAKKAPAPAKAPAAPRTKAQPASQTVKAPTTKPQPVQPAKTATAPAAALDLEALKAELKQTKAIGLMTKLSLKNKVDDLLADFRKHHEGKPTPSLADLRRTYDLLMMKVLTLLQDRDQKLASEIVSSREQIWGLLADPKKFATLPV